MEYSASLHRPLHIYADDVWYFITASTVKHARFLKSDRHLTHWRDTFFDLAVNLGITICAWAILENHYHILIQPPHGRDIGKFIGQLHGKVSHQLNAMDETRGRQIWYSYWDACIRDENDFWAKFNYIHYNPVKHGYVNDPGEWDFSSYCFHLREQGKEWLAKCWLDYPANDLQQTDRF